MERTWDGAPWDAVAAHLDTVDAEPAVARATAARHPGRRRGRGSTTRPSRRVSSGAHPGAARTPAGDRRLLRAVGRPAVRAPARGGGRARAQGRARRPPGRRARRATRSSGAGSTARSRSSPWSATSSRRLVDGADVLVTNARPRAIEQLDLDLDERVHDDGLVWVSITGYGYESAWRDRVAFGDDAAVAGGLAVAAGGPEAPGVRGGCAGGSAERPARCADPLRRCCEQASAGSWTCPCGTSVAHAVASDRYGAGVQEVA